PVEWQLGGSLVRWHNPLPIEGGKDAQSTAALLAAVRARLREDRVLATAEEIAQAALMLDPALAVARATVVENWARGRAAPGVPPTRTLIVGHCFPDCEIANWLARIRRAIVPRIAIGERLLVVRPAYVDLEVHVSLRISPGADRAEVEKRVRAMLDDRFDIAKARWPLGRDADPEAMAGWVRQVPGVAGGAT